MSITGQLDPLVQPDQLREQILAADPEPPRCKQHRNPQEHLRDCAECREHENWRKRINRRCKAAGVPRELPRVVLDPEPLCRHGHTDRNKMRKACDDCRARCAWYARESRRVALAGIERKYRDLPRLREHIEALQNAGMVIPDIARAAKVSHRLLQEALNSRRGWVRADGAQRILNVPIPQHRYKLVPNVCGHLRRRVDATGTHRRIRCGQVEGHPLAYQAERLGWALRSVEGWLTSDTVTTDAADAVKALFPQLIAEPGTCAKTKGIAAKRGWPAARYFSEANIDDPAYDPFRIIAKPYGVFRMLRALAFIAQGPAQVAAHIGESPETVELWMEGGPAPAYAHHMVVDAYEALSGTQGPDQQAADRARQEGWGSPLAWDGVDIDKPTARPRLGPDRVGPAASIYLTSAVFDALDGRATRHDLSDAELVDVVTVLHRRGWSDRRIAVWLRWNAEGDHDRGEDAVDKFRERNGITGFGALLNGVGFDARHDLIFEPSAA